MQAGGLFDLDMYLLANPQTKLVVIDTLAKVRMAGRSNGNMYQDEYDQMGLLKGIVATHEVAIIAVHHTRKMPGEDPFDEISGSTAMSGAADTNLVLKRERGQQDATLHISPRDTPEQELALTLGAETCAWTCTGNVADRQTSQARQEILDLLREREAMTPAEIAKELGKAGAAIRMLLARMVKEGTLFKNAQSRYTVCASSLANPSDEDQVAD